jgi:hypothetical protein
MSVDHEDLGTLGGMLQLGAQYIAEATETEPATEADDE